MKRFVKAIIWLIIVGGPFLFWFLIYKAWTLEYDENFLALFYAFVVSLIVPIGVILLGKVDRAQFIRRLYLILLSLVTGSPLAFIPILVYVAYFQMNYISSESSCDKGICYSIEKRKNYFKAENTLIINDLTDSSLAINAVISRNGNIKELFKVSSNDTIRLKNSDLSILTLEQKEGLLSFN